MVQRISGAPRLSKCGGKGLGLGQTAPWHVKALEPPGSSNHGRTLLTDAWPGYKGLPTAYPRGSVDHHEHQYVVGADKVSAKYLPLYVAEFQFRYNNRMNVDIFGTAIGGC